MDLRLAGPLRLVGQSLWPPQAEVIPDEAFTVDLPVTASAVGVGKGLYVR